MRHHLLVASSLYREALRAFSTGGTSTEANTTAKAQSTKVKETGLLLKDDIEEMVVVLENSNACFEDYYLNRGPSLREGRSITDELNF